MSNIKVSLRNVRKVFDPAMAPALDGVSLEIAEGGICVLMGLSGSGKSPLLRSINCLCRPRPDRCWSTGSTWRDWRRAGCSSCGARPWAWCSSRVRCFRICR